MTYLEKSFSNVHNFDYLTSYGDISAETWLIAVNSVIIRIRSVKKNVVKQRFVLSANLCSLKRLQLARDARKIYLMFLASDVPKTLLVN